METLETITSTSQVKLGPIYLWNRSFETPDPD